MATEIRQGYYSLLRWRPIAHRDEATNVAVILVDAEGEFGGIESISVNRVSKTLGGQGILDAMINDLKEKFEQGEKPDLEYLRNLHNSLERSIIVTEPQLVVVSDEKTTLKALKKAYIATPAFQGPIKSKADLLTQSVDILRLRGLSVDRGSYYRKFYFDLIIRKEKSTRPNFAEVLTFNLVKKNWVETEQDAGHFLYALKKIDMNGFAIVQAPTETSVDEAFKSHERVMSWFKGEKITVVEPNSISNGGLPAFVRA